MTQLLKYVDKIARELKRDVIFISFVSEKYFFGNWEQPDHPRQKIIKWLDENNIAWKECAYYSEGALLIGYDGMLYIDLVYDPQEERFQKLAAFLEDENGNVKSEFPDTQFCLCTLEHAMKNAHRDEPGYREEWWDDP